MAMGIIIEIIPPIAKNRPTRAFQKMAIIPITTKI